MTTTSTEPIEVLLLDDNDADLILAKEALSRSSCEFNISVAKDGREGLAYLRQEYPYESASRPDIIFLDLHMPNMNGFEFLKVMRKEASLCDIPVIMLSSSKEDANIRMAYQLQANSYVVKPDTFEQYRKMMECLECFWTSLLKRPG